MNTETTRSAARFDDALYALAQGGPVPDAALLDSLVRRYPHFAAQLTELAIELALDVLDGDDAESIPVASAETSDAVSEAMSHFHNRLYAVRTAGRAAKAKPVAKPENPFAALDRAALRALGARLNANTVFVMKLRDRQIALETIPHGFKTRLAEELRAPLDVVVAHFAGQSELATATHYKADRKPETGPKQTFKEAVRSSGLSEDQQSHLLSL
jgi:hypothetical protein